MKAEYFIFLFIILVIIVILFNIKSSEGFQPKLRVPDSPVPQQNLVEASDEYIGENLLGPSPGSIASFNSLPFRDPANEKASMKRILNLQTTLNGFLENAGSSLKDSSDPSIQLPYITGQSDNKRLKNETLVLKRNPGIESSLTQGDIDDIEANLSYLQKKHNLSIYSEGFQNPGEKQRATLTDLNTLISRLTAAKASLGSSGTTDPVVQGRINVLGSIQSKVQAIIDDVNSGARPESQIPIYEKSYHDFLKVIQNNNSPLPKLLGEVAPGLADLFPAYSRGDVSGAHFAQYLFDKYADVLFKGLSWDFSMNYKSESEQENSKNFINALSNSFLSHDNDNSMKPFMWDGVPKIDSYDFNTSPATTGTGRATGTGTDRATGRGTATGTATATHTDTDTNTATPLASYYDMNTAPSTKPTRFDWHERANFICDAIGKHGLKPGDFGCLGETEYVSDTFSWRGYAKMICSRLGTSHDPGLPGTCGCPPLTWSGWRAII